MLNQKLINVLAFTAGATIGSLVTWGIVKAKYEKIVQEEVASVKETWARMAREESGECDAEDSEDDEDDSYNDWEDEEADDEEWDEGTLIDYRKLTKEYKNGGEGEGDDEAEYVNGPQVITPEEFGDGNYGHSLYVLTYYTDGVLANDWDEVFDIEETIGEESLEHFGDHVEDVVHVRNERLDADYEVVRDCRTYTDVLAANNPQVNAYGNRRPS